jgi:hypothetical protein
MTPEATKVTTGLRASRNVSYMMMRSESGLASASQASRRLGVWVGAADDFLYTV